MHALKASGPLVILNVVCQKMIKILTTTILFLLAFNFSYANEFSQSIAVHLQAEIDLIAIDPGFGGNENGPSGYDGNSKAKNISLHIAKKLSEIIKRDLAINTIITRENDTNISLEQRTTIANTSEADLFVSIHTNGFDHPSASGIETYYLNLAPEPDAVRISAMENSKNPQEAAQLESILTDLLHNANVQESELLATNVQKYLFNHLKRKHKTIKNRGVKQPPFYILLGAEMPSIMVQAGFITNPMECKLLISEEYQEDISTGIVEGIRAFIKARRTQPVNSPDPKSRAGD